ncbi:hypothetical protein C4D60_Mb11t09400 [Musa balbisiana]|uniref:Histidine-containing phosphotransfer protein n=1 Tax=Musa balbisiana TaxID=52838 RepID=A0A4S8J2V9_MUSBA|nr:hypothetical protein C4D60_Mb11t09400 [Musa balbisiana]
MALHISSAPPISALHHLLCFFLHDTYPEMEYASSLQRQLASMKKNLFDQGYLDEQFYQLEELQDESSPNFERSCRMNPALIFQKYLQDFRRLDNFMHQLKGSASSIGAAKMKNECTSFREFCNKENREGCLRSFQKVKKEHAVLKQKLENYFQLLRQVGPVDKATRSGN